MQSFEASVVLGHRWMLLLLALASPAMAEEDRRRDSHRRRRPSTSRDRGTGASHRFQRRISGTRLQRSSGRGRPIGWFRTSGTLFDALRRGESDLAVVGVFYTTERDRDFDFTYSTLNTGLQVMVSTGQGAQESPLVGAQKSPLVAFLRLLFSRSMLYWLVAAALLLLVPANVIWLLDRRNTDGVSPTEKYFPGIFYAMSWAAEGLLGQAMLMPKQRIAQLFANLWLFVGVVFVAFFTAQMTATLTVEQIRGAINGPDDLPGKSVATPAGSPSATYLRSIGAQVQEYARADEMFSALLSGKAEAVVSVAPTLQYFAAHDGAGRVRMVGPEFRKEDLMFVVPLNSTLRRRVNGALVAIHEDGTYQRVYEKWFGKE